VARRAAEAPRHADTLVLFDYHVDNLMLLPDRLGVVACGLLDFQDALVAPRPSISSRSSRTSAAT
jgi:aminoglycoside/choline kinase family phosphotransferase